MRSKGLCLLMARWYDKEQKTTYLQACVGQGRL